MVDRTTHRSSSASVYRSSVQPIADLGLQNLARADDTQAAQAFNISLQISYIERLDLDWSHRFSELGREHGADPEAFANAVDAEASKARQNLPPEWQGKFDTYIARKKLSGVDHITGTVLKQAGEDANATHKEFSDTNLSGMANALRRGDVVAAQEAKGNVLAAIQARTDLSPQQKADTVHIAEREWQRQSVLGEFEAALQDSPDAARKFVEAFAKSDTLQNPQAHTQITGEMKAHLSDTVNAQTMAVQDADAAAQTDTAQNLATLDSKVAAGTASHADVEAAHQAGLFDGDPQAKDRLAQAVDQKIIDRQKDAARVKQGATFFAGTQQADPLNREHRKAADRYFESTVMPDWAQMNEAQAAASVGDFVGRTGIIPAKVKNSVRAALSGGDAPTTAWASDVLTRIEETHPKALDAFTKQDLARAQMVNKFVSVGVAPADAVARARAATDPANAAQRARRQIEIQAEGYPGKFSDWINEHYTTTNISSDSQDVAMSAFPAIVEGVIIIGGRIVAKKTGKRVAKAATKRIIKWVKNRQRDKFSKSEKDRYTKDNAGNVIVKDKHGNVDRGTPFHDLSESELKKAGLKKLSVRLEKGWQSPDTQHGDGDVHIDFRHGKQIRAMVDENGDPLFKDVADYVEFINDNWTEVRQSKAGNPMLIVRDPSIVAKTGKQKTLILELKKTAGADFYSVKTAGPFKNAYLKAFKPLLNRGGG